MIDRRAVKGALCPTPDQERFLFSCATLSRKAYNWGLERSDAHFRDVVRPARARGEKARALTAGTWLISLIFLPFLTS